MDKYLCSSWKNFLYVLATNISQGYYFYSKFEYPETKKDKWFQIDTKLKRKLPVSISKDQRYRKKKKGEANYRFFRFENQAVFLKTKGTPVPQDDEKWAEIAGKTKLPVQIGTLIFEIFKNEEKFSVKLARESFRDVKAEIRELLAKKQLNYALKKLNNLNGLPNYRGIQQQKKEIIKFFKIEAKKHFNKVKIPPENFKIKTTKLYSGDLFIK